MDTDERNGYIRVYHTLGLSYCEILRALAKYNRVVISLRHLKRILKLLGLTRRLFDDVGTVITFMQQQISSSGRLHGYRWMYEKCRERGISCKKEDVRVILGVLDADGCEQRKKRRLRRRKYLSRGPNYIWHVDSYDKLKRFGICVNGCIDGFSRHLLWLNCYTTSSDPRVIGGYYLEAVSQVQGCPTLLRGDRGTENVRVRQFQRFLRRDGMDNRAGDASYIEGPSTANQRIEYWWNFLRRECTDFWISLFRELETDGHFDGGFIDINLIQFCFMAIIQACNSCYKD